MPRIGVVHRDLMAMGGGEAVCLNMIEALNPDFEVTLYTLRDPNFDELNEYYNTSVQGDEVNVEISLPARLLDDLSNKPTLLKNALLLRTVNRHSDAEDLFVSTLLDEVVFDGTGIQYLKIPRYDERFVEKKQASEGVLKLYDKLCYRVMGFDEETFAENTLVAMSNWTSKLFNRTYGVNPHVVYPPVKTDQFTGNDWESRELGFVSIGRISSEKNLIRNIKIIVALRELGHPVHYHIVGPPGNDDYTRSVKRMAEKHEFVHFEGKVEYSRLVELIETHKFGLHGRDNEHFGIAVAELIAGGTIPFVPSDGGQCEIVGQLNALMYDSKDDAVTKTDSVLSNEAKQRCLRDSLPDIEAQFGAERFRDEMRTVVNNAFGE